MVHVDFIDNTSDDFEIKGKSYPPWQYLEKEQCFFMQTIEGDVLIPAAFIKCLRHYEVEKYKEE